MGLKWMIASVVQAMVEVRPLVLRFEIRCGENFI
jgi:hypothetical protein